MDAQLLRQLMAQAGIQARDLPTLLDISPRQVRRYLSGEARVPGHVKRLLWLKSGALGLIAEDWRGWRLVPRRGELVSPAGDVWTAEQLMSLHWHHEQLAAERAALRAEIDALRARVAGLEAAGRGRAGLHVIEGGKTAARTATNTLPRK